MIIYTYRYHTYFWGIVSHGTEFYVSVFFSQHFIYHTVFCMHGVWGEFECGFYFCSFIGKLFFPPLASFSIFFFWWFFYSLKMIWLSIIFFFWHFYCLMFSELSESLVCCLTLIWEIHSHCCFKYFFCPFLFSPSAVPIMWLLYHLQLSSSSWIFSSAFSVFFLFAFQFEEFLLKYPQLHKFFLQPCPSIISPSKTFLMLQYFFISIISFFFPLEFPPVCLYFQFVLACCLVYSLVFLTF